MDGAPDDAAMEGGPPRDPLAGRQRFLIAYLRVGLAVVLVLGVGKLVAPETAREELGAAMLATLVAVPVVRVAWLVTRWVRIGDWRFALLGVALLGVVAVGALV